MFNSRPTLPVDWTQENTAHGILRAWLHLPTDQPASDIELTVDGRRIALGAASRPPGSDPVPVNIHTHLLANGAHEFSLAARVAGSWSKGAARRFDVRNEGPLAERVADSLRKTGAPLAFVGDCDAAHYDFADATLVPWFDREDAEQHVAALRGAGRIDDGEVELLLCFVREGHLVLSGALSEDAIERALADIDTAVRDGYQGYQYGDSTRLEQMHVGFPAIRELWLLPRVHRLLGLLFGEVSEPCQSLVYVFGSQQDAHQDTIHLTPFPAGYMCGVWIALEDVREGSGELMVYPGSHRLPRVYMKDTGCAKVRGDWAQFGNTVVKRWEQLVAASGIAPRPYLAKRGDILIWHENLMHAGSIRRDKSLSRRSVVTHNFARGSLVFYDSTGAAGLSFPIEPDASR